MKLSTAANQAQEWLANRFTFIQYPNIDPFRRPKQRAPFFSTPMPWYMRIGLLFFGAILVLLSLALLIAFGVAGWALLG